MKPLSVSRRRYQKGTLIDDADRWTCRWREDVIDPATGQTKRVHRWDVLATKKDCPTKRLAQRKLDAKLAEINHEDYRPAPSETFGGFARRWMSSVMVHHKPSTQRSETSVINVHLIPTFGDWAIRDITAETLQRYVTEHKASPKTVSNIIATLKSMWTTAQSWGHSSHDPFKSLRLPTVRSGGAYDFSVEEALAIIAAADGWKRLFLRTMAETGVRPGEIAGLRIECVLPRQVKIAQSVWQSQIQTPKTSNSLRTFAISAALERDLRQHIAETQERSNPYGLVFTSETGGPLSMDNFRHRVLDPILVTVGLRDKLDTLGVRCGLYGFRHMNATVLDSLGTPLATRQRRLGHAPGSQVTLKNYTHSIDADDLQAADQLGAMLEARTQGAIQ